MRMKRIEFLAPVEAMRGNLSGNQNLLYPTQNNKAWDSPTDKRNYAVNYSTRYIGNKRVATGKKYFSVKTKTAVKMTEAVKLQQAALSVGSVIADLISKNMTTLDALTAAWLKSPEKASGWTFKRWLSEYVRRGLKSKRHIAFPTYGTGASVIYINPYVTTSAPSTARAVPNYPSDLLIKFWLILSINGGYFYVNGMKAIYNKGQYFPTDDYTPEFNVLGLGVTISQEIEYVTIDGDFFLLDKNGQYVQANTEPLEDFNYTTTEVSPNL